MAGEGRHTAPLLEVCTITGCRSSICISYMTDKDPSMCTLSPAASQGARRQELASGPEPGFEPGSLMCTSPEAPSGLHQTSEFPRPSQAGCDFRLVQTHCMQKGNPTLTFKFTLCQENHTGLDQLLFVRQDIHLFLGFLFLSLGGYGRHLRLVP